MIKPHIQYSISNYTKALSRLEKSIRSGKFAKFTQYKKQQLWQRLCRYAKQSGIKVKAPIAAACLAAGLSFSSPLMAQSFNKQTGAANPLNSASVLGAFPTFVDIDGDGDKDAFVGAADGTIAYFKNTGTASSPVFISLSGTANPLNGITANAYASPVFVDIDGDGDKDVFIGGGDGTIKYYKNTGTNTTPVFTAQTGAANPFNGLSVGGYAAPVFDDIDGDGDFDAIVGQGAGTLSYYKNTGTSSAPVFIIQTGAANPFDAVSVTEYSAPAFVDIDGDGDQDLFVGGIFGNIAYYKNIGTATTPSFVSETGSANPFDAISTTGYSSPVFVDIDGDGDFDAFIGANDGTISYYKNTSTVLPIKLISFSGNKQSGYNHLQWTTASEANTKRFEIEVSSDGHAFSKIASVDAAGSGSNLYGINDRSIHYGKTFYRLKMIDTDGKSTYSQVIWITSNDGALSIYPNPARDVITINTGFSKILQTNASIYDASGKLLKSILLSNYQQQLSISSFAKGMYQIRFADGTIQSFIKE